MKISQLILSAQNNDWSNVNHIIENSGLEIELIHNLPFLKLWSIKNNKEVVSISNTMDFKTKKSHLAYCLNCH